MHLFINSVIRLPFGAVSSVGRASRLHREGREFESLTAHHFRGCSSAWLERLPVTQEAAGSSPVTPANINLCYYYLFLCF